MSKQRPVVRYHGGKWNLADWIISHFPAHRVYVEPFGGGGSVLMKKPPSYAEVYNDLDGEIVNVFRVLRDHGEQLRCKVALTPFSRDEFFCSYEPSEDSIEQARRTIARSFMGFGSNSHNQKTGFRANSNRSGTTPARDWKNYPDAIAWMTERLIGVVIENRNAQDVMAAHDGTETLHYVDPPYLPETRDKGGDYRHEMTPEDHESLADFLNTLDGKVVLSGYPSDLYNSLYSGWERIDRNALADNAKPRVECLWLNFDPPQASLF